MFMCVHVFTHMHSYECMDDSACCMLSVFNSKLSLLLTSASFYNSIKLPSDVPCSYSIMLQCWKLDSKERPNFTTLIKLLDQFIYKLYPYMMMEIEECANEDGGE